MRALAGLDSLAGRKLRVRGRVFLQEGGRPAVLVTRADDLSLVDGEDGTPERGRD